MNNNNFTEVIFSNDSLIMGTFVNIKENESGDVVISKDEYLQLLKRSCLLNLYQDTTKEYTLTEENTKVFDISFN